MKRAIEAVVDDQGRVRLLESVELHTDQRVLVLVEENGRAASEVTRLSERALAEDWERPEEEAAWSHLQPVRSS